MATKQDLAIRQEVAEVKQDLAVAKQDIADLRRDMVSKADLHSFEVRLMVRLGGYIAAIAALTIAVSRFLS